MAISSCLAKLPFFREGNDSYTKQAALHAGTGLALALSIHNSGTYIGTNKTPFFVQGGLFGLGYIAPLIYSKPLQKMYYHAKIDLTNQFCNAKDQLLVIPYTKQISSTEDPLEQLRYAMHTATNTLLSKTARQKFADTANDLILKYKNTETLHRINLVTNPITGTLRTVTMEDADPNTRTILKKMAQTNKDERFARWLHQYKDNNDPNRQLPLDTTRHITKFVPPENRIVVMDMQLPRIPASRS